MGNKGFHTLETKHGHKDFDDSERRFLPSGRAYTLSQVETTNPILCPTAKAVRSAIEWSCKPIRKTETDVLKNFFTIY